MDPHGPSSSQNLIDLIETDRQTLVLLLDAVDGLDGLGFRPWSPHWQRLALLEHELADIQDRFDLFWREDLGELCAQGWAALGDAQRTTTRLLDTLPQAARRAVIAQVAAGRASRRPRACDLSPD